MNATWQAPDFSECISPAYKTLHQEVSNRNFDNRNVVLAVRKEQYKQGVGSRGQPDPGVQIARMARTNVSRKTVRGRGRR